MVTWAWVMEVPPASGVLNQVQSASGLAGATAGARRVTGSTGPAWGAKGWRVLSSAALTGSPRRTARTNLGSVRTSPSALAPTAMNAPAEAANSAGDWGTMIQSIVLATARSSGGLAAVAGAREGGPLVPCRPM